MIARPAQSAQDTEGLLRAAPGHTNGVPSLVLGPLLRYVDDTRATVWVQSDAACEVVVLTRTAGPQREGRARTFCVAGRHYAIVVVEDLAPGTSYPYEVQFGGERIWPPRVSEYPGSSIRTLGEGERRRVVWGSCRSAAPYDRSPEADRRDQRQHVDALREYAVRMAAQPADEWPDLAVFLGDQIYAEKGAPETRRWIRSRRDTDRPPGDAAWHFEEFAEVYRETWDEPDVRWLLSTVPSVMIFDDHEIFDDWNISAAWVREMRATEWWPELVSSALAAYWIYQQLGNLRPEQLAEDEVLRALHDADDGLALLKEHAGRWDRGATGTQGARWSLRRDLGSTRLVLLDSRNGRVLDEQHRSMLDDAEFAWLEDEVAGDFDHLLVGTSVPWLLPHGMAELDAWCEALCRGSWGALGARAGEVIRRAADSERWPAFQSSFLRLGALLHEVATGERGTAPASVLVLSGDVHHGYAAEVDWPDDEVTVPVWQLVCSPFRYVLDSRIERVFRAVGTAPGTWLARRLARLAGVPASTFSWNVVDGPWFANQIATLDLDEGRAVLRHECVAGDRPATIHLETVDERELTLQPRDRSPWDHPVAGETAD